MLFTTMMKSHDKLKYFVLGILIPVAVLFFASTRNSPDLTTAELAEALSLISSIKTSVAEYYFHTGHFPNNNSEAELPPPEALFGRNVKQITILAGGIIRADFHEKPGNMALMFFPIPHQSIGRIEWECGSDTIPGHVLVQLNGICKYLPLTSESKLVRAVERGDLTAVRKYLENGAKVDAISDGTTALMLSVLKNNPAITEELLRHGALVDYTPPNSRSMTPLIVAVKNSQTDIAKILISYGASVTKTDKKRKTAIHYAQQNFEKTGDSELLDLLNEAVPSADVEDSDDSLHDENARTNYSDLLASIESCNQERFQQLLTSDKTLMAGTVIGGLTLFSRAVRSECLRILEVLLTHTPVQSQSGASLLIEALKYAPQSQLIDTLKLLVTENTTVNGQNASEDTPLMTALSLKLPEAAEFLLNHQADPNQSGTSGSFPIIESSIKNFDAVTKLLIAQSANVNAQNIQGRTALMAAVEHRNRPIVELLLQHGADPHLRDKQDIDAILIAKSKGYADILKMLRESVAQNRAGL